MEKEQISEKVGELIDFISEGVKASGEFVIEQTPLLVKEILLYHTAIHGFWSCITIAVIVGFFLNLPKVLKREDEKDLPWGESSSASTIVFLIVGGILTIISLIGFPHAVIEFIKVTLAPRLFLLEYIKELI